MRRWRTFTWATVAGTAAFVPFDVVTRHWFDAAVTTAGGATAAYFGRRNDQFAARNEQAAHRPDYAKIRRLELELGLRDPDPPKVQAPPADRMYCAVCRTRNPDAHLRGCPYDPVDAPHFETGLPPSRFDPRSRGQHYELEVPPAVTRPDEWAYCPVCTRRHAGRCAG